MYPNHRTIHMCCSCRAQSNAIIGERTVVPSQDLDDVTKTSGTGRTVSPLPKAGALNQRSTMNRIFGTSSSSKKPKPTLQDVIDQVCAAPLERYMPRFVPIAAHRRIPAQPLSKSR
jgi:hypothetical protein